MKGTCVNKQNKQHEHIKAGLNKFERSKANDSGRALERELKDSENHNLCGNLTKEEQKRKKLRMILRI